MNNWHGRVTSVPIFCLEGQTKVNGRGCTAVGW